jgi:hypothetical protein
VWELAADAAFTQPIATRETEAAEFNSGLQSNIKEGTTYYWRVKSLKANAPVATSEVRSFNGTKFKITSPADASVDMPMTPGFTWTDIGAGAVYTLEISAKSNFDPLIYSMDVQATTASVPAGVLSTATTYYARVRAVLGTIQAISERIHFTTEEVPVPIPELISPADGATIAGVNIELRWQPQESKGFQAELSQSESFPSRSTTRKSVEPFVYTAVFENLAAGDYYARVRAKDSKGLTEPSDAVKVYLTGGSGLDKVDVAESFYSFYDSAGNCYVVIDGERGVSAVIDIYSLTGVRLHRQIVRLEAGKNTVPIDLSRYAQGVYLIKINTGEGDRTLKVKK